MRIMLLAALAIAAPALAQTPPPADPAMQAPGTIGDTITTADPATTGAEDQSPANGDVPAAAAPVPPGPTVVYRQAPDAPKTDPAPAPLADYPPCRKGQYDDCMEPRSRK